MDKTAQKQISMLVHGVQTVYTTAVVKVDIKVINTSNAMRLQFLLGTF